MWPWAVALLFRHLPPPRGLFSKKKPGIAAPLISCLRRWGRCWVGLALPPSAHVTHRDLVLVLTIHEPEVQHSWRATSTEVDTDTPGPTAPTWLVAGVPQICLITGTKHPWPLHAQQLPPSQAWKCIFLIQTERGIYEISLFSSCCWFGPWYKINQKIAAVGYIWVSCP